jgi:hypothetical protein
MYVGERLTHHPESARLRSQVNRPRNFLGWCKAYVKPLAKGWVQSNLQCFRVLLHHREHAKFSIQSLGDKPEDSFNQTLTEFKFL